MPGMDALKKKALAEVTCSLEATTSSVLTPSVRQARAKVRAEAAKANAARLTKETEVSGMQAMCSANL